MGYMSVSVQDQCYQQKNHSTLSSKHLIEQHFDVQPLNVQHFDEPHLNVQQLP